MPGLSKYSLNPDERAAAYAEAGEQLPETRREARVIQTPESQASRDAFDRVLRELAKPNKIEKDEPVDASQAFSGAGPMEYPFQCISETDAPAHYQCAMHGPRCPAKGKRKAKKVRK